MKIRKAVLIVVPNDNLGGAEQFLKMIAEHYLNAGYSVNVYFLKSKISGAWDHLESKFFNLHFTKATKERHGIFHLLKTFALESKINYEYAFTSHVHVNSYVSLLRKLGIINVKYHISRESTCIFDRYKGFKLLAFKSHYKFNYSTIDLVICQTKHMQEQLISGMPKLFERVNIATIPNPINLKKIAYSDERVLIGINYIISAGRLIPEKGFDILIRSFSKLVLDRPDLQLVILGEGPMRGTLTQLINDLQLEKYVKLLGFVDNVFPYFKQAELCVVSSRIEGFPNVLLQMMSQNTKVVSTMCAGGIDEIKGVYVTKVNDIGGLYLSMKSCLSSDTSANKKLFENELQERSIDKFVQSVVNRLKFAEKTNMSEPKPFPINKQL